MRRALVVVVLLVAIVVAGCGGDDGDGKASAKQVYAKQLADAAKPLRDAFSDSDQVGANVKTSQIVAHLDQEATTVEDAVEKIRAIKPPAALAATHAKLVEGLRELAASFRKGAEAARRNDTKTLATALRKLTTSEGVKKLTQASAELKAQGVTVTNASSSSD
jgi:predicted small secreted protein